LFVFFGDELLGFVGNFFFVFFLFGVDFFGDFVNFFFNFFGVIFFFFFLLDFEIDGCDVFDFLRGGDEEFVVFDVEECGDFRLRELFNFFCAFAISLANTLKLCQNVAMYSPSAGVAGGRNDCKFCIA